MGVIIGLSDIHYATLNTDSTGGTTYGTPVAIPGAISAKVSPKTNTATLYADDGAAETASALGEIEVEIQVKDLPLATQAALLGGTVANGILTNGSDDNAPYVALGFKSKKSNGKYRFVWLYKGKFTVPDDDIKTQEDKPTFQTPTIKGTFVRRESDHAWRSIGDEDEVGFTAGATWFNAVPVIGADTTPPTLTSTVPANNATAVVATSTYQWIFSEAIEPSTVNAANFFLVKDSDGSAVAGTLAQSADKKTITFDPTANLSAATAYRAMATVGVKDLAGNAFASNQVNKFTTA